MKKNNRLIINLISCMVSFFVTIGINFFLTPYITESIGVAAFGFVTLANNFVNYAAILTLAINSMSSRFISISYHKEDLKEANEYFNSVLITNLLLIAILFIPSVFIVIYLDKIIKITPELIIYVKVLFGLVFVNFFVGLINTIFSVATFIKNRVDLVNLRTMESNIFKTILMIILFSIFKANIIIVGIAYLFATLYLLVFNINYMRKLVPEIKFKKVYFNIKKIKEIFISGIWNTVTKLGQVLSDGLDLLICNLFVNSIAMGELAVSKTISSCISTLNASLSSIFHPKMTYYYAKESKDDEINEIKFSMKIGAFFTNILLAGLIAYGLDLFKLWIPSQNIEIIYYATFVSIIGAVVGSTINTLFNIFTITNKLKLNSIVTLVQGFLSVLIVYILLKLNIFENYEIILISGVSVTISLIKNLTFTPMYAAHCLDVKKNTFYGPIVSGIISSIILVVTFTIIDKVVSPSSWGMLIIVAIISSIIGVFENFIILFNSSERKKMINLLKNLFRREKKVE